MGSLVSALEISPEAQEHPHWVAVQRACESQCLHSSARLRDFLLYVADCALRNAPEAATEQQIGIHVFGRAPGYNSSEDSIVRTHARLLRQRLAEYYAHEGVADDVVIEIPKGHYLPTFGTRAVPEGLLVTGKPAFAEPVSGASVPVVSGPMPMAEVVSRGISKSLWWIVVGSALCVALLGALVLSHVRGNAVDRFWAPFLADNTALVIYSNAVFTGDSTNGLKYAPPDELQKDPLAPNFVDTYTGIGELASVYNLTQLFDAHHAHFLLKRSMLVTWDEARLNNLVFIGSVAENPSLRVLPASRDFNLKVGAGYSGIANLHPRPGEPAIYARPEHPFLKDYAILALLPGLQPGKKMLVFSGLTTLGTQAAVEFACHRETAEQLLNAAAGPDGEIRPFEAVLETAIGGGVPLQTRLVTVHVH